MILQCNDLSELPFIAKQIIDFGKGYKIWLLNGRMGAGKTTLTQAICKALGSMNNISSPTFSLVNEYVSGDDKEVYHFDFYRIESEIEAVDVGCDEYFYSGNLCLIEWSEKIPSLIPSQNIEININLVGENNREIHLTKND